MSGKVPPTTPSVLPPVLFQPTSSASFDSNRRQQSQSPSFAPSPRKGQGLRKQHRNQKRPGYGPNGGGGSGGGAFADGGLGWRDDDDAMAELRVVRHASSRRGQTSITHLLNYAPPSRSHHDSFDRHGPASSSRAHRRHATYGPGSGRSVVDKSCFIHANYRFVVSPDASHASAGADADQHLEWADVLQIIASSESQQASCPICLSEPVAPRMARCGHIFCLACLIRFMNTHAAADGSASTDKRQNRWRKCPICDDSVYIADVRPLRFYAGQESRVPSPGDDVVLRLMKRRARSTLALPNEGGAEVLSSGEDVPWHSAATVLDYARIMKGTGEYMDSQFDAEIEAVEKQQKEDELLFHEDGEWTRRAIKAIRRAKEKVSGLGAAPLDLTATSSGNLHQSPSSEPSYYFYTSPPHLYLSPLDIRMLKTKYGDFAAFPSTLLPRVEHVSPGHVVDDALRKRAKYLGHLPQGSVISFLECDWTGIVPTDILEKFSEDIERRRKRNRDKAAQEERERLQAERLEAAAILGGGRRPFVIESATDDEVMALRFGTLPSDNAPLNPSDFQPLGATSLHARTPPNSWPDFAHRQTLSTSPSGPRTVWGTAAVAGLEPELAAGRPAPEDDGWLKDDEVLDTLSAADVTVQMEALGVGSSDSGADGFGASGGIGAPSAGKKKKKQRITLMSTGGRRGN